MTITSTAAAPADGVSLDSRTPHADHPHAEDTRQSVKDTDDWYFDTLRTLTARAMTAKAAMLDAHLATTPHARVTALADLHHHLRAMAGIVNDTLGSMGASREPR